MGLFKQESAYERKKRELEEETERVRKNMQSLMKTVKKNNDRPVASALASYDERDDEPVDDCIVTVDDNESITDAESVTPESSANQLPPYGTARLRHFQNQKKENFSGYLASGSFGKRGPVTREKKIQRNKAVFMAVLAILAIFSLISWLK